MRTVPLAAVLLAGCYSFRPVPDANPVRREPIRVVSDAGFAMRLQHVDGSAVETPCRLTRAEGTVTRTVGDTIWLERIVNAAPAAGESAACASIVRGSFVRDASIGIAASRYDHEKTKVGVAVFLLVAALLTVLYEIAEPEPVFATPP